MDSENERIHREENGDEENRDNIGDTSRDDAEEMKNVTDSFIHLGEKEDEENLNDFGMTASPRSAGIGRYKRALKHALPVRFAPPPKAVLPIETNGFFNYITFGWLTPLIWKVYKGGAQTVRGLRITKEESAEVSAQRMERFWQEEVAAKGEAEASFTRAILRSFKTRLIIGAVASLLYAFLSLANPILVIRYFLDYLTQGDVTVKSGIVYAIALAVILLLRGVTGAFFWMLNYEAATRIKYGSLALLYRKVVHLKSLKDKTVGDIVNFISNDGQRIWDGIIMGPFILGGPMILIISCAFSVVFLGPWALVSFVIVVGFYPFAMTLAKKSQVFRLNSIKITDKRVSLMNELLTSIRLIKMYAWEISFAKKISDIRSEEKAILEKSVLVQSLSMGSSMMVPIFASCITFVAYVATGNNLTATEAFTFVSLLNAMQASMATLPFALKALSEMCVTTRRIKEILVLEEMSPYPSNTSDASSVLEFKKASFAWGNTRINKEMSNGTAAGSKAKNRKKKKKKKGEITEEEETLSGNHTTDGSDQIFVGPTLRDVTFTLQKGHLLGVCGSVGSGKSSLISAILGRMDVTAGTVAVSGRMAYVSQQAWVTNDTIRDNIVFGYDYDADRYKQVVEACALTTDFQSFPSGDVTEVGERGASLSGGQKQRVSLARAAYSKSDVILLDDPLSAVDVHVGQHIFQECIMGLLKGRTVVFVTHHVQYLKDCDNILVMKDGMVVEQGTHNQLQGKGKEYANLLRLYSKERDEETGEGEGQRGGSSQIPDLVPDDNSNLSQGDADSVKRSQSVVSENGGQGVISDGHGQEPSKLITDELMDTGALQRSVVHQYIKYMGGYILLLLLFLCFCLPVAGVTTAGWYLSYWLEQGGGNSTLVVGNMTVPNWRVVDNPDLDTYLLIYVAFLPLLIVATVLRSFSLMKATLRASSNLHDSGFMQILRCPMSFFDSTPVGRIVNRFSADLDEIDVRLPMNLEIFLSNVLQVLAALAMISYVAPWFLLAVLPFACLFFFLMIVFHVCIRQLKCLDNVTRSPVISHMTASAQGLASIHAYNKTKEFVKKHCELLNTNSVAVFLFYAANRWLALRLDFVSAGVAFVTGLLILLTWDHLNPALAGLALSYAGQMSGLFQFTARLAVETEARFTSVQRILEYCNINDKEATVVKTDSQLPAVWPKSGAITFSNVKLRYRSNTPLALKGVSFRAESHEKIGIVGRSGAGKSSLTVALFRLVELTSGQILIDDLDISQLALDDLRSRLSIIPQDPVLFSGTLRYNLDPFNQFSDADIWQSLERCHVAAMVKTFENQLDATVTENGDNFSVGERQLICMARALLRNSKILVLDEATAAIDSETDALVQKALKDAFSECTMLVIAHRLHTVIHCDKILLMEDGLVKEFDTPSNLLSNPNSKFKAMLDATSSRTSES